MSESITMIAPDPDPQPAATRAPTKNVRRPSSGADDFAEEVATGVLPPE